MTKQTLIVIIGAVLILGGAFLLFGGSSGTEAVALDSDTMEESGASSPVSHSGTGDRVPDLELKTGSGESVVLSSFEGKPHVINSWATWCPFCVDELPDFVLLQEEFGEDVIVIAVNRRESVDKSETFLSSIALHTDDLVFLYDSGDSLYRTIGGFTMPETLFVDAEGNVIVHKRGFMDLEEMREHVEKIISS